MVQSRSGWCGWRTSSVEILLKAEDLCVHLHFAATNDGEQGNEATIKDTVSAPPHHVDSRHVDCTSWY
eukprot:scaffold274_cov144-Skeletonema_menzelii.AAC.16